MPLHHDPVLHQDQAGPGLRGWEAGGPGGGGVQRGGGGGEPQGLLPLLQPRHPRGLDGSEVLEGGGYVRLSPGAALQ